MIHRTIVTSFRLTALLCRWMITFILLLELSVLPHGMRALAAGTRTSASKKQTQSTAASGKGVQTGTPQRPVRKMTLRPLDLSRVPTEEELKMAGQRASRLSPSAAADPAKIAALAHPKREKVE